VRTSSTQRASLKDVKVASETQAVIQYIEVAGLAIVRIGLEARPVSQWLRRLSGNGLDREDRSKRRRTLPAPYSERQR
jgi:hypothetical protein